MIQLIHDLDLTESRTSKPRIISTVGIYYERVHSVLMEDLVMKKLSSRWVMKLLMALYEVADITATLRHFQQIQITRCNYSLPCLRPGSSLPTGVQTQQSKQWKHLGTPHWRRPQQCPLWMVLAPCVLGCWGYNDRTPSTEGTNHPYAPLLW